MDKPTIAFIKVAIVRLLIQLPVRYWPSASRFIAKVWPGFREV